MSWVRGVGALGDRLTKLSVPCQNLVRHQPGKRDSSESQRVWAQMVGTAGIWAHLPAGSLPPEPEPRELLRQLRIKKRPRRLSLSRFSVNHMDAGIPRSMTGAPDVPGFEPVYGPSESVVWFRIPQIPLETPLSRPLPDPHRPQRRSHLLHARDGPRPIRTARQKGDP
jgi:hypothetical protein